MVKKNKNAIIFAIGVATIGLAEVLFMQKMKLLVNYYLAFQENDFYKFVNITLIIFIILLIVTLCLNFIVVYKNFNSTNIFRTIEKLTTTLKIEIKV